MDHRLRHGSVSSSAKAITQNMGLAAALLTPSLLCLALFTYWPVILVSIQSLTLSRMGERGGFGTGNFQRLFADPHFGRAVWNNIVFAIFTTAPTLAVALLFALALQTQTWLTAAIRTLIVMPLLIPLVAAAALFSFILLPGEGLLDTALARFGLGFTNWLGNPDLALGAVIGITIWKNTGYYLLFFLAGLAGVPQDLLDAAQIDGAGVFRRFWHVTLPMLMPTLGFVLPVAILNSLTQIDHVITITPGGPTDSTNLLLYYIYEQAAQNGDTGLAAAATLAGVAALLAITAITRRALDLATHYES